MATTSSTTSSTAVSATSSGSATAQLLSTLGAGSGINSASLAEQLSTAQFASRLDQLSAKNDKLTTRISAASTLKNMIGSLATSMGDRVRTGDLAVTPVIANSTVATVTKGSVTGSGTLSLEVTQLAKGQTLTTPTVSPATATVGSGTLTLRFGSIAAGAFTADASRSQIDVTVASGATLADVASAINAKGAGISAYVATSSSGAQLVLKGADGAANGFVLEANENAGDPGLASLAWNPATGSAARLKTSASDAAYTLDGVARTSTSNTIADAAPGVSLKLTGTNTGSPTTISFSDPASSITTAMNDLVSALNEIVSELNTDTNANTGTLTGDPGARAFRRTLTGLSSTVVMPNAATGAPKTLADIGLSTNRDGTFTLDTNKLSKVLASNPSEVSAMFTNGLYGVYATLDKVSRGATSATDPNSLGGSIATMTKQQTAISTLKSDLATKQETLRTQLVSRYAKLDTKLSDSKSTLSFLTAQITAWNSKGN
ncbi:flagellar filament capping protein FliD [Novosphingobium sp. FKTRR1]|uniref:flagellar filament capping protein FliD n=1 Tax=Novosphingobium sp. FKTRR1 TaxID=2879118 RepID=UPI001CF04E70|nr:flagellar filament capping protein FliD [Novosphingobium sp. FKTRR1]